jgi:hypothetical protein
MIYVDQTFKKYCVLYKVSHYLSRFPMETSVNDVPLINIKLFVLSQFV